MALRSEPPKGELKNIRRASLVARILIIYHSQTGNTEKMAQAVARGAGEIENTTVSLKRALDTKAEDLIECDGLVIGSPEYFGYMSGAVKDLFDRTYEMLKGHQRIFRKPFCIFVCAGNDGLFALKHIERIALGYQFKKVHQPIVCKGQVTDEVLAQCEEMGRIIAAGCEAGIF